MSHKTFKVSVLIDNLVENFYIKHYIDDFQPVFSRFKNQVFQRNPNINATNLKIYWIDSENDEILIACEEDFRLFLEEGTGRKIYFSINSSQNDENLIQPMEAENIEPSTSERRSRKGREERHAKKIAEELKRHEEKKRRHLEKQEQKQNERIEKAKRRVDQIRSLIVGSIDPANLNNNMNTEETPGTSTSVDDSSIAPTPSPETIRLLSNAIAGCLQPCSLINKILNEVITMIPQMVDNSAAAPPPYAENQNQEQRTQATNTSDVCTPKIGVQQASNEIEALFKEAAKELEKMNEIVNSSKSMETSTTSSSGFTAVTQVEKTFKNITDSAISNATVINMDESTDAADAAVLVEEQQPKSIRSRESSIEVHDINSIMSDDSRDWTLLSVDQEEIPAEPRAENPANGAIPKKSSVDNSMQVDLSMEKASAETQTPPPSSILIDDSKQQELQASVLKSIDIVQKSIETIQKSMEGAQQGQPSAPEAPAEPEVPANSTSGSFYPQLPPLIPSSSQSMANLMATGQKPEQTKKAVIIYDVNPKINASIHTMMSMGFTNEDNWLTQLMVNVEGDIPKALNFLTPQPKNAKKN